MYGQLYSESRQRVTAIAKELSDEQLALQTSACPGWTVGDVLRHVVGGARCFATGDMDGAPGEAWTARHLAERSDRTVPELLAEWDEFGPRIEALPDDFRMWLPVLHDVLSHETDLSIPVGGPRTPIAAIKAAMPLIDVRLPKKFAELGTVELVLDNEARVIGEGDPVIRASADLFEFWRGWFGRRSLAQMRSWVTAGDAEAFAANLPVFPVRSTDLVE